ncbi:MAG TPA: response regulator transcription factor [Terriglobia bacterium]|nr:response regulator transcription factor [Terriglobia bacterium]
MLRILLADDHSVVRRIVRNFVQSESGWEVCAEATTGREAVVMTAAEHPDVVILDLSMPDLNGLQAATLIHNQFPETQLILLTMHDSLELKDQLTASGIRACIRKDDLNQLVMAIRNACQLQPKLS